MSCNSCGTGKDAMPAGCRNNGTCGTGGCNKLNVFNWLNDMQLPSGQEKFPVIEVRFKGSRKEFYYNKPNLDFKSGDVVAVEGNPGHDMGVVSLTGELVRFQLKKKNIQDAPETFRQVYRIAKQPEIEKWYEVKDKEIPTLHRTREIIQQLKLTMKLGDVEFQGDGKKATFFYTADDRVDFRELIKKLAEEFHIRIEMRQIGMRQEASRLGGIGVCGRELCCSTWLTDFKAVTTSTARYQNLALNQVKLAGQCGKLKCCLNYELDSYMDALKDFPQTNIVLETEKGRASHRKTDIFKRTMWYAYSEDRREHADSQDMMGEGGNWIALPVERVNEIIELNRQKIKPAELRDASMVEEVIEKAPDYANVVGQDRIDRMDKLKKKKKKKPFAQGKKPESSTQPQKQNTGQQATHKPQHQKQPSKGESQQQGSPNKGSRNQNKNNDRNKHFRNNKPGSSPPPPKPGNPGNPSGNS
ncbi:MAG: hypothetical protein IT242_01090 [Bacteroidia bacterium]|nr:hypothetical protein [Bacteroidia bacterium]